MTGTTKEFPIVMLHNGIHLFCFSKGAKMFFTLGYLLVELYNWYRNPDMRYLRLLRNHIDKGSVLIRAMSSAQDKEGSQNVSDLVKTANGNAASRIVLGTERRKQIISFTPKVIACYFHQNR